MWGRRSSPNALSAVVVIAAVLLVPLAAGAQPVWRAKIDRIDTSNAPKMRLFVTYLDKDSSPVNPALIDFAEVFVDGRVVPASDVEVGTWREEPEGTDVVMVVPATGDVTDLQQKAISESLKEWVGALGPDDRVAVVAYSFSVEVLGDLSRDKGNGLGEYDRVTRKGLRPFMFSSIDRAITLLETSPPGRKRAVIYIGDGSDAEPRLAAELSAKVEELWRRARKEKVGIWSVAYGPSGINELDTRTLRLISRKTGATFRAAESARGLQDRLRDTFGEIAFQLVVRVHHRTEEDVDLRWTIQIQAQGSPEIETKEFRASVGRVAVNWLLWITVSSLSCIVFVVSVILMVVIGVYLRRRRARKEAEELLSDLLEERDKYCETCHRKQKSEWDSCPFCAAGMAPVAKQHKEPPFVYDDEDRRLCNTCGRVAQEEWAACAFCAQKQPPLPEWEEKKREEALLLGKVDADAFAAQMQQDAQKDAAAAAAAAAVTAAEAKERQDQIEQGGVPCATCKRIMKPEWPECLHCASGLPPLE
jgi:hypothetical protein